MKTFTGNCDSFNALASARPEMELVFQGKLDLPVVSTQDHPLQTFKIEGLLNLNGTRTPRHATPDAPASFCGYGSLSIVGQLFLFAQ